jgi:hypothetical protein
MGHDLGSAPYIHTANTLFPHHHGWCAGLKELQKGSTLHVLGASKQPASCYLCQSQGGTF